MNRQITSKKNQITHKKIFHMEIFHSYIEHKEESIWTYEIEVQYYCHLNQMFNCDGLFFFNLY